MLFCTNKYCKNHVMVPDGCPVLKRIKAPKFTFTSFERDPEELMTLETVTVTLTYYWGGLRLCSDCMAKDEPIPPIREPVFRIEL
jgi:hypothetical protein